MIGESCVRFCVFCNRLFSGFFFLQIWNFNLEFEYENSKNGDEMACFKIKRKKFFFFFYTVYCHLKLSKEKKIK